MPRVGFVGLGKLGLPVATAMASRGAEVVGYDPHVDRFPSDTSHEEGFAETIEAAGDRFRFGSLAEVVEHVEVVFLAVQTPHEARFEGIDPLPDERKDFDYRYLIDAVQQVRAEADLQGKRLNIAVISTVLPGTMARYIEPLLGERLTLTYTPSFIAMGTTVRDFLDPEFVLIGGDEDGATSAVFDALGVGPIQRMSVESAELTKVAYNTFIGLKLAFANTLMEVCHKTEGTDVDEVTNALGKAHRRLISPAYLTGGMGDGGGCHPRDNIALSWLARELDLSYDLFEATMLQRERQTEWLADLVQEKMAETGLPCGIMGIAYKPGSAILTGSPAIFLMRMLTKRGVAVTPMDPYRKPGHAGGPDGPMVLLVGCRHPEFPEWKLPKGSVVIDPWRYIPDAPGIEVIRLGERVGA